MLGLQHFSEVHCQQVLLLRAPIIAASRQSIAGIHQELGIVPRLCVLRHAYAYKCQKEFAHGFLRIIHTITEHNFVVEFLQAVAIVIQLGTGERFRHGVLPCGNRCLLAKIFSRGSSLGSQEMGKRILRIELLEFAGPVIHFR